MYINKNDFAQYIRSNIDDPVIFDIFETFMRPNENDEEEGIDSTANELKYKLLQYFIVDGKINYNYDWADDIDEKNKLILHINKTIKKMTNDELIHYLSTFSRDPFSGRPHWVYVEKIKGNKIRIASEIV